MELNTFSVRTEKIRGKVHTEVTFDEAYNLPDYRPDFSELIISQGRVQVEETKVVKGHVTVKGNLHFELLYRTRQMEPGVSCLDGMFPFQETLAADEAREFDTASVRCELEDLSIHMTNSRKLGVRALVGLTVEISEFTSEEFPSEITGDETTQVKNRVLDCLQLKGSGRDECRLHEEIELPANKQNIKEILWRQVQLQSTESRSMEGKIQIRADLQLFVLYTGEPEERLEWYETKIPVVCEAEAESACTDQICYITARLQDWNVQGQEDLEGEQRIICVDGVLQTEYRLYEEQHVGMLEDMYALDRRIVLQKEQVQTERLLMKNNSRCKVSDTITLESGKKEILQICSCFGSIQTDHIEITEEGILAEGAVRVQILYFTRDDSAPLDAAEGLIPFSRLVEAPGITPECRYEMDTDIVLLSVMIRSGNILEVQAVIDFNTIVFAPDGIEKICSAEEEKIDWDKIQQMPGMIGLRIREGDTLWNIARENHTTVAEIRRTNQLPEEPLDPGTMILLMKTIQ